ncbi:MAG: reverse transcriptase family protein [Sutterellaceae bacterium]|nr:reverse transcriptase family protein [Sutterellaceae bacterium]MDY2867184.1 reverse transcriptase family protein [Mesosutterella sp.]
MFVHSQSAVLPAKPDFPYFTSVENFLDHSDPYSPHFCRDFFSLVPKKELEAFRLKCMAMRPGLSEPDAHRELVSQAGPSSERAAWLLRASLDAPDENVRDMAASIIRISSRRVWDQELRLILGLQTDPPDPAKTHDQLQKIIYIRYSLASILNEESVSGDRFFSLATNEALRPWTRRKGELLEEFEKHFDHSGKKVSPVSRSLLKLEVLEKLPRKMAEFLREHVTGPESEETQTFLLLGRLSPEIRKFGVSVLARDFTTASALAQSLYEKGLNPKKTRFLFSFEKFSLDPASSSGYELSLKDVFIHPWYFKPEDHDESSGQLWKPFSGKARLLLGYLLPGSRIPDWWSLSARALAKSLPDSPAEFDSDIPYCQRLRAALAAKGKATGTWADLPWNITVAFGGSDQSVDKSLRAQANGRHPDFLLRAAAGNDAKLAKFAKSVLERLLHDPDEKELASLVYAPFVGSIPWLDSGGFFLDPNPLEAAVRGYAEGKFRKRTRFARALIEFLQKSPQRALPPELGACVFNGVVSWEKLEGLLRDEAEIKSARSLPFSEIPLNAADRRFSGKRTVSYDWERPGADRDAAKLALQIIEAPASCGFLGTADSLKECTGFRRALLLAARALNRYRPAAAAGLELLYWLGTEAAGPLRYIVAMTVRREGNSGARLDSLYHDWMLPKKSGGNRVISTPERRLKIVQRLIHEKLLLPLGAHEAAHGFAKGRSIVTNAANHVGKPVVVAADVSNCFPNVSWKLVLWALRRDLARKLLPSTISLIVDICTAKGGLPIGSPASPALLNRVLFRTDQILSEAAARRGCAYSRYADDICFSGDHGAVEMLGIARSVFSSIGLKLDDKKTNIFRRGRRQCCTGLVVNERVSVPRRIRKRLRAEVHAYELGRALTWHGLPESAKALEGRISFVTEANPEEGRRLKDRFLAARRKRGGK